MVSHHAWVADSWGSHCYYVMQGFHSWHFCWRLRCSSPRFRVNHLVALHLFQPVENQFKPSKDDLSGSAASLCHLWMEMNGSWLDQRCSWKINKDNSEDHFTEPVISDQWLEILVTCVDKVKTNDIFWWWKTGGERERQQPSYDRPGLWQSWLCSLWRWLLCLWGVMHQLMLCSSDWRCSVPWPWVALHTDICLYLHLQSVISEGQTSSSSVRTFVCILVNSTHSFISTVPLISGSLHRTALFVVIHLCVQPLCPQQSVWSLVCWRLQTQRRGVTHRLHTGGRGAELLHWGYSRFLGRSGRG